MPSRILRDSALESPQLAGLSDFAERVYFRLHMVADDWGDFNADPELLVPKLFPFRAKTLDPLLILGALLELQGQGLAFFYCADQGLYGHLTQWAAEQRAREKSLHRYPDSRDHDHYDLTELVRSLQQRGVDLSPSVGCGDSRRVAASCGELRQNAASGGACPHAAASCGLGIGYRVWGIEGGDGGSRQTAATDARPPALASPILGPDDLDPPESAPSPNGPGNVYSPGFRRFCEAHPHGKERVEESWGIWQRQALEPQVETICAAVEQQKQWPERSQDRFRFFPRMPRYLQEERWKDQKGEGKGQGRPCVRCRIVDQDARELHWVEDFGTDDSLRQHCLQAGMPQAQVRSVVQLWREKRGVDAQGRQAA